MPDRAKTLASRAWSSTSLQAGVAYSSAMSGNKLEQLSKDRLIKKLQEAEALLAKQKAEQAKVEPVKEDGHVN
ncbi:unnamed protein product, partial [Symbiodinium microadriaticum]